MDHTPIPKSRIVSDLIFAALAFVSVGLLAFEFTHAISLGQQKIFTVIDLTIAALFAADFAYGLISAPKTGCFLKNRWYEVLAFIPLTDPVARALRSIRLLSVIRLIWLVRFIRTFSRLKRIDDVVVHYSKNNSYLFSLILAATLLVYTGAVAFFKYEFGINPNVNSFFDSLWWSIVTLTTVGYGDIVPITTEGRIVAIVLMLLGIGVLLAAVISISERVIKTSGQIVNRSLHGSPESDSTLSDYDRAKS